MTNSTSQNGVKEIAKKVVYTIGDQNTTYFAVPGPTDLRKSQNKLIEKIKDQYGAEVPYQNVAFMFCNHSKSKIRAFCYRGAYFAGTKIPVEYPDQLYWPGIENCKKTTIEIMAELKDYL